MIIVYVLMLLPCDVISSTIDAESVLSEENQNNGWTEPDTRNKIERELATHVHDQGSNMVKRLLKNYESYQNVLQEREVETQKQENLKNSVFMDQFHNAAGVVKDYGRTGYVRTPVKSPSNISESAKNDENEMSDEDANNETELKVGVTTTTEVPEQIGHAVDDSVEVTTSPTIDNDDEVLSPNTNLSSQNLTRDEHETPNETMKIDNDPVNDGNIISEQEENDSNIKDGEGTDETSENPGQGEEKTEPDSKDIEGNGEITDNVQEKNPSDQENGSNTNDIDSTNEVTENLQENNSGDHEVNEENGPNTKEIDSNNEVTENLQENKSDESTSNVVDDNEDREGRIVNKAGARRRLNGGGPIRISSYRGSEDRYSSVNSDRQDFHPRPVFSSPSQSQTVHNHIHNSDEPAIGFLDDQLLQGIHQHEEEATLVFRESDEEMNTQSQETSSGGLMGWISNMIG